MSHDMQMIASRLREAGFRVTPQRQLILDTVCALGGHVTPEAVYEQVIAVAPAVNRATVYRTLHFLSEQGIMAAARLRDGRTGYEITGARPHHHLVCRRCEKSIELPHKALRQLFGQIAADYDFAIELNHLSFFGRCAACRDDDSAQGH